MSRNPRVLPFEEWPSQVRPHTVTFVRHGDKNGGGFSADLTPKGRSDSVNAGTRIGCRVDLFIASPSPRTVSTAMGIRSGNGSSAKLVEEEHLAEPGLGMYTEFRPAMKAFLQRIVQIIDENKSDVIVATTHNYVLSYISALFGAPCGDPGLLSGITVNLEILYQTVESL